MRRLKNVALIKKNQSWLKTSQILMWNPPIRLGEKWTFIIRHTTATCRHAGTWTLMKTMKTVMMEWTHNGTTQDKSSSIQILSSSKRSNVGFNYRSPRMISWPDLILLMLILKSIVVQLKSQINMEMDLISQWKSWSSCVSWWSATRTSTRVEAPCLRLIKPSGRRD